MAATFPAISRPSPVPAAVHHERIAPAWCPAQLKAMALWPRLNRRALARAGCSPARIASYVARRTRVPAYAIEKLLEEAEAAGNS